MAFGSRTFMAGNRYETRMPLPQQALQREIVDCISCWKGCHWEDFKDFKNLRVGFISQVCLHARKFGSYTIRSWEDVLPQHGALPNHSVSPVWHFAASRHHYPIWQLWQPLFLWASDVSEQVRPVVCLESHVGKLVWHLPVLNAVWQKSVRSLPPFCKRWIKRRPLLRDFCLFYFYFIFNDNEVCPVYRLSFWGLGCCLQLCWGCPKHVATCLVAGTWSSTMCCWTMRDTASWQTSECARRAFTMALPQLPSAVHQTILLQR